MGKKIYVGNLSFNMDDQQLSDLFANFGTVESAKIVTDRDTGRSKGFGFVDMATAEDAANAITTLNNSTQKNRQIVVKIKEPKPAGDRGGFRSNNNSPRW